MKKNIILIICVSLVFCTFESCRKANPKAAKAVVGWFQNIFRKKPPVNPTKGTNGGVFGDFIKEAERINRGDLKKSSEVIKYFNSLDKKSGTIIFKDFTETEVKAIVKNAGNSIERKVLIDNNLLYNTFRKLDYANAKYKVLGNGLVEVTIPYYSLGSYLKFLVYEWYLSDIKRIVNKLSFYKYNDPYSEFEKELTALNISVKKNITIVEYIKSGIIVENILIINNDERLTFPPNLA